MATPNIYQLIIKILDLSTVNGVLPYSKLSALLNQYGTSLQELPLSVLHDRKFEVKPGVILHFKSDSNQSAIIKKISFNDIEGFQFSYQNTDYCNMKFKSGINQVIFGENGVEILDSDNHFLEIAGQDPFLAPAA